MTFLTASTAAVATPALLVDLDRTKANITQMARAAHAAGLTYFPHAKSHRSIELGRLQLQHGADGLCLAKLGEAEVFAEALAGEFSDLAIVVAYPMVGTARARRALALAERISLTVGTDSVAAATDLSQVFSQAGKQCRVLLAVDSGLGREGVAPADAVAVATAVAQLPGITLAGIYTHEGTVMGATDPADLVARSHAIAALMSTTADHIRAAGIGITEVSVGCSGSATQLLDQPGLTQVRPGINTFGDLGQHALGTMSLDDISVRVIATVVSHPEPGRACIDAGTKAIGADLLPASAHSARFPGHGLLVNAPGWQVARLSEEHGWLRWAGPGEPSPLPIGSRLELVPNHVCVVFGSLRKWTGIASGEVTESHDCLPPGTSE